MLCGIQSYSGRDWFIDVLNKDMNNILEVVSLIICVWYIDACHQYSVL